MNVDTHCSAHAVFRSFCSRLRDPAGLINRCGGAVAGRVHGEFVDEYEGNLDHMGLPK